MAMEGEELCLPFIWQPAAQEDDETTDESTDRSMEEEEEVPRSDESMVNESSPDNSTGRRSSEGSNNSGEGLVEIMERRANYTDEDLLSLIGEDKRYALSSDRDKKKIITKLRHYFASVIKTEGFQCTHFPGPISDLTTVEPRDQLIYNMNRYEECFCHLKRMAKSAIDSYNKEAGTRLRVKSIETVTLWKIRSTYYITFSTLDVHDDYKVQRFQSIVQDRITLLNKSMEERSDKSDSTDEQSVKSMEERSDKSDSTDEQSVKSMEERSDKSDSTDEQSVKSMDEDMFDNSMEEQSNKLTERNERSNKLMEEVPSSFNILLVREIGAERENNVCEEEVDGEDSSEEYDETSDEDGDDSDDEDLGLVDTVSSNEKAGITDVELLSRMKEDSRSLEVKTKLLPKIRRYLKTIAESEGFDCTHYPGYVSGVTTVVPRQIAIEKRARYPEGYRHIMFLSSLAINDYNKKCGTKFQVVNAQKVNMRVAFTCVYYITFCAWDPTSNEDQIFQGKVTDNICVVQHEVLSCRPSVPAVYSQG